mmetsp:Transcript_30384/g.73958  ORF Transcript_30384/g.73958 Transcript_30384/m.73958 type:complete len:122 (+) Transcript_30384:1839-2204(+)
MATASLPRRYRKLAIRGIPELGSDAEKRLSMIDPLCKPTGVEVDSDPGEMPNSSSSSSSTPSRKTFRLLGEGSASVVALGRPSTPLPWRDAGALNGSGVVELRRCFALVGIARGFGDTMHH